MRAIKAHGQVEARRALAAAGGAPQFVFTRPPPVRFSLAHIRVIAQPYCAPSSEYFSVIAHTRAESRPAPVCETKCSPLRRVAGARV